MNEVITAIMERRSIRSFTTEMVKDGELEAILQAASYAPTFRNTQAWFVLALVGLDRIRALDARLKEASLVPGFDRYRDFVSNPSYTVNYKNAPLFVIVGVNPEISNCPLQDGSLVIGNILLAAHSLDLGACWINQLGAVANEPGFRAYLTSLGFPATHSLVGSVAIGHVKGEPPKATERRHGQITILR
ncbi:MAG: nitroreductase family protein [Deltaproteobacteria bacterium]|jgi:nitroreductase|nr:nitroreductase family protein [Deltaproteobacteria bacterium]